MLRSMTGYGHDSRTIESFVFTVDMKSVNHRYLEVMVRLPREWAAAEDAIRRCVQSRLRRGRVDVTVSVERSGESTRAPIIDWPLAEAYVDAAQQLTARFGFPAEQGLTVRELLALPGVFTEQEDGVPEQATEGLLASVEASLEALCRMRETEGAYLCKDALQKITGMNALVDRMQATAPTVVEEHRARLQERIAQLLGGNIPIDPDRLATEVAYFADRTGIDEELTRLRSHTEQFTKLLSSTEPTGRKLDFLLQEMNREANTIGSKANHAGLSAMVVDLKAELEKLREQVQNFE